MKLCLAIVLAMVLMIKINSSDATFPQNNNNKNLSKNMQSMVDIFGGIMKFKKNLIKMMQGGVNGHFERKLKAFDSIVSKSSSGGKSSGGKSSGHSSGGLASSQSSGHSSGGLASSQSSGHSSGGHSSGGHSSGGHASSGISNNHGQDSGHQGYGHESGK